MPKTPRTIGSAKKKIFVGMSGGVDSSVTAALLLRDGHDVVGVFIKVWQADFLPCAWREERREAMRAAAHLGIPLITLDLEKEYKKEVVEYMIREYSRGQIPNPDVMCNKHVKFGAFLDFAKKNGADHIATGHYARITHGRGESEYKLLRGVDQEKDQSYFLWTLTQGQLAKTLFPVGDLQKSEVRKLAKKFNLPNAEKKDSQGLCFMGPIDVKEFLTHYVHTVPGIVLDIEGHEIGTHDGALLYTIGQRHGFHTTKMGAYHAPVYVIKKDMVRNTITVSSTFDPRVILSEANLHIVRTNWISTIPRSGDTLNCLAQIRYHGVAHPANIRLGLNDSATAELSTGGVEFVAPGQSLVCYASEICLGGGVIE